MSIELTTLVDDVMRRWPATIRVFLDHGMHCVGCPITSFHTVDDACREHGVDRTKFLDNLQVIAASANELELVDAPDGLPRSLTHAVIRPRPARKGGAGREG